MWYLCRMRWLCLSSLLLAPISACGPGKGGDDSATAGSSTTGETASTGGPGSTGTTVATVEPTSSPDTSDATGRPTTGEPGTTTAPGTTATATSSATTDTTTIGPGTTGSDTDGAGVCDDDGDCELISDCCDCQAILVEADPPDMCDAECKQSMCSALGIQAPVCRLGVCIPGRLSCDQSKVQCDAPTPDCPAGTLPETTPACWTGDCVPAKFCDVVPDCALCPTGTVCVQHVGRALEPGVACEPVLPTCDPAAACGCIGDQVCAADLEQCFDQRPGVLTCECKNC